MTPPQYGVVYLLHQAPEQTPGITEKGATATAGGRPAILDLGISVQNHLNSPTPPLDTSKSSGVNASTGQRTSSPAAFEISVTSTSVDDDINTSVALLAGPQPEYPDADVFPMPPGRKVPPKDSTGPSTRLSKKAENLSEELIQFLTQLLDHVNQIPQEVITMIFLEPLVSYDSNTKKFIQDPSRTTSHNIQALEQLIHITNKEKENLFQQVGKIFVNQLGKWTKHIPRQSNKD